MRQSEREASGNIRRMMIVDHKGDLHPQIVVEDEVPAKPS